jgi:hypothetical protein
MIGVESALAAVAAAGLYACTLAPGVGAGDGGELLLAASTLGVPHPPGYPLWTMAGAVAAAVPWGTLALRVNALSAAFAAAAAGLLWAFARRAGVGRFGAAIATSLYVAAIPVWRAAVEAEVYSLAAVAFLALLHLAWTARARGSAGFRADALYFFVAGLAYLAHQTLAAPALVLGAWVLSRGFRWRRALAAGGWTLAGLSPVLLVPIRTAAESAFAWKVRAPFEALADAFSRVAYGEIAQNPPRLDLLVDGAAGMAGRIAWGAGFLAVGLAVVHVVAMLRNRRGRVGTALRAPAMAALSVPAGLLLFVRFTPDAERLAQLEPFLIPVTALLALSAGAGAALLLRERFVPGFRIRSRLVAAGLSVAVAATVGLHLERCDRSDLRLPERYGRDLLASVPAGATLVVDGDNETFLAAYLVREEGARPDLTIRHRRGCVFGDAYALSGVPRAQWTERARAADLEAIGTGREMWFATPPADLEAAGVGFATRGLSSRALAPGAPAPEPWHAPATWPLSSKLLGDHPERYDFVTRKLAIAYSDAAARAAWNRGDARGALAWYEDAARVGFDTPEAHWNVAVAAAAAGMPDRALDALIEARVLAPHRAESAARLAAFLAAARRYDDAARWFERAFRDEPSAALAADASRAWTLAGDDARAAAWRGKTTERGMVS